MTPAPGPWESGSRGVFELITPFLILLAFLTIGSGVQSLLGTWIPGSVIGMLALSGALWTGVVRVEFLEKTSDLLLANLGLFFVCPGVEIINFLGLIEEHWLSLTVAIVGSSLVTLVATGIASGGPSRQSQTEIPNPFRLENKGEAGSE